MVTLWQVFWYTLKDLDPLGKLGSNILFIKFFLGWDLRVIFERHVGMCWTYKTYLSLKNMWHIGKVLSWQNIFKLKKFIPIKI
jgi:hypothetical protein